MRATVFCFSIISQPKNYWKRLRQHELRHDWFSVFSVIVFYDAQTRSPIPCFVVISFWYYHYSFPSGYFGIQYQSLNSRQ
jgi:hypothetical protein